MLFLVNHDFLGSALGGLVFDFKEKEDFESLELVVGKCVVLDGVQQVNVHIFVAILDLQSVNDIFLIQVVLQLHSIMLIDGLHDLGLELPLAGVVIQDQLEGCLLFIL